MTAYDDILKPIKRNFKFGLLNVIDENWNADIRYTDFGFNFI